MNPQDSHRALVGDTLLLFLEASAIGFRHSLPEVYAKVDAIKADPDRLVRADGQRDIDSSLYVTVDCARCGDDFTILRSHWRRSFCSKSCASEHRWWLARRR